MGVNYFSRSLATFDNCLNLLNAGWFVCDLSRSACLGARQVRFRLGLIHIRGVQKSIWLQGNLANVETVGRADGIGSFVAQGEALFNAQCGCRAIAATRCRSVAGPWSWGPTFGAVASASAICPSRGAEPRQRAVSATSMRTASSSTARISTAFDVPPDEQSPRYSPAHFQIARSSYCRSALISLSGGATHYAAQQ
jgi:hypothetical protein